MKKILIVTEFDSAAVAAAFLARLGSEEKVIDAEVVEPSSPAEKTRKARSDAGQPRGPNARTTGANPAPTTNGGASASAPASADAGQAAGATDSKSTQQGSTPAAAASSSAPAPTGAGEKAVTPASAPTAEEFPATLDGARKAMKKLNDTPSKGMDACIAALKAHGVNRISDLPKEKFGDFIKYVLGQIPAEKK